MITFKIISDSTAWYENPQWVATFIALLLGLAGIFQERIRKLFYRPKARISMELQPPDCLKIPMRNQGQFVCCSFYFRFRFENTGNYQMEDVEAIVIGISKKEANGEYKTVGGFLPLNLVWAYDHKVTMPKIQPQLFKHLDFGSIVKSEHANLQNYGITDTPEIVFLLSLNVKPNHGPHILLPGDYQVTIKYAANNMSPVSNKYHLVITDKWADDEQAMLQRNISIKEV